MFNFLIVCAIITVTYLLIAAFLDSRERHYRNLSQEDILSRIRARNLSEDPAERQKEIHIAPRFNRNICNIYNAHCHLNTIAFIAYPVCAELQLLRPTYALLSSWGASEGLSEAFSLAVAFIICGCIGTIIGTLILYIIDNLKVELIFHYH